MFNEQSNHFYFKAQLSRLTGHEGGVWCTIKTMHLTDDFRSSNSPIITIIVIHKRWTQIEQIKSYDKS